MEVYLKCIDCGKEYELNVLYRCAKCNGLLDVIPDIESLREIISKRLFDSRICSREYPYSSGVWRFRELIHPIIKKDDIISRPEGNTNIYRHKKLIDFTGLGNIVLKHEGENPTGSFKDRGISPGISEAKRLGMNVVACASTGNTSASLASYASLAGMKSIVFVPQGKIASGKLSQALAYGANVLQIRGNFDDAMSLVQKSAKEIGMYLLNSVNPWRIEGQKSIIFELIQQLNWNAPDWIVVPAGNLGNTSAFGKALKELYELELIEKIPRIASIQASKSDPFYRTWMDGLDYLRVVENPETIATAIKIGNPVSWKKALRAIKFSDGVVEEVSDQEIMDAKAIVDSSGIGCEPASAASVAGAKKLMDTGVIEKNENVVCIITGNILKDPEATVKYHFEKLKNMDIYPRFPNKPVVIDPDIDAVRELIDEKLNDN
ncbi:MAG: threonine synthase [Candidatus Altiarchaeales archaeon]|nr:MAG: threonine synthase [Candidatus Altiarchaeales archaeon]